MAVIIFPSENAVGTLFGSTGQVVREQSLTMLLAVNSSLTSFVKAGFDVTAIPASNGVRLTYGSGGHYAFINGYLISFDATMDLTGLTNNTHYIYAVLAKTSSLVTGWDLTSNTTGTAPTDSVCLATVVVAGVVAGTPTNAKKNPFYATGSYAGDNAASRIIFTGVPAKEIHLYGYIATGPSILCHQIIHPTEDTPSYHWVTSGATQGLVGEGLIAGTSYNSIGFNVGLDGGAGFNWTGATYNYIVKC